MQVRVLPSCGALPCQSATNLAEVVPGVGMSRVDTKGPLEVQDGGAESTEPAIGGAEVEVDVRVANPELDELLVAFGRCLVIAGPEGLVRRVEGLLQTSAGRQGHRDEARRHRHGDDDVVQVAHAPPPPLPPPAGARSSSPTRPPAREASSSSASVASPGA